MASIGRFESYKSSIKNPPLTKTMTAIVIYLMVEIRIRNVRKKRGVTLQTVYLICIAHGFVHCYALTAYIKELNNPQRI